MIIPSPALSQGLFLITLARRHDSQNDDGNNFTWGTIAIIVSSVFCLSIFTIFCCSRRACFRRCCPSVRDAHMDEESDNLSIHSHTPRVINPLASSYSQELYFHEHPLAPGMVTHRRDEYASSAFSPPPSYHRSRRDLIISPNIPIISTQPQGGPGPMTLAFPVQSLYSSFRPTPPSATMHAALPDEALVTPPPEYLSPQLPTPVPIAHIRLVDSRCRTSRLGSSSTMPLSPTSSLLPLSSDVRGLALNSPETPSCSSSASRVSSASVSNDGECHSLLALPSRASHELQRASALSAEETTTPLTTLRPMNKKRSSKVMVKVIPVSNDENPNEGDDLSKVLGDAITAEETLARETQ